MKRKIVSIMLCVTLISTLFVGCGSSDDSEKNKVESSNVSKEVGNADSDSKVEEDIELASFPLDETYTVEAFAYSDTGYEMDKTLTMKIMEERTNIHWDLTLVNAAEMAEKRNLSFNSGEYYDVYIKSAIGADECYKYGQQGIIIPLNDLIDKYMPNLKAVLDEQDIWGEITSGDGNIYALPQINRKGLVQPSMFINQKWLDAVGKDMPTTADEFLEVLRAFKYEDPNGNGEQDEYPIYCPSGALEYTYQLFGIALDYNTHAMYKDNTLIFVPTSEENKEWLSFWAAAYEEGLLNQNYYMATWDDLNAIGATSDTIGMMGTWGPYLHVGTERDDDFVGMIPFNGEHTIPVSTGVNYGGLVITDKCEHPELICQWADYLYSEEGAILSTMGAEGETFTLNDDGTYTWKTDGEWGSDMTEINNRATIFGNYPAPLIQSVFKQEGNTNQEELNLYRKRLDIMEYSAEPFPTLKWTDDETKELSTLSTTIYSAINEYQAQILTGQKNIDDTWDDYVESLNDMGLERLIEIYKAAYERWLAEEN